MLLYQKAEYIALYIYQILYDNVLFVVKREMYVVPLFISLVTLVSTR